MATEYCGRREVVGVLLSSFFIATMCCFYDSGNVLSVTLLNESAESSISPTVLLMF